MTDSSGAHTVGILSLGLIGGSFAKAFVRGGYTVYAYDVVRSVMCEALADGIAGELNEKTIGACELIVLAGYPEVCVRWLEAHAHNIASHTLVIDTAGVKRSLCTACNRIAAGHSWTFIGCHPMAGTQFSGYGKARANMFVNAPLVVCLPQNITPNPTDTSNKSICARLRELLEPCGFASFTSATPDFHDEQIAYTSQLAHVVSNAYVKSPAAQAHKGFSAGSYKDLTRVARLNATMWTELFLDNADNLSSEIETLIQNLQAYKDALDTADANALHALLEEGDRLKREAEAR
ncbi:prephenate dehydrogenase [Atopobium fossor]|uniref:prephenate dehydrogenase n=1 Tax=Atopobium fossor TaxID=39487 RepID=UPI0004058B43|nr:prephenate dehydrogenase [Atopobium fossor]